MPSPWIDLLTLHGYITDHKLLRTWATRRPETPSRKVDCNAPLIVLAKRVIRSTRLCLGIGDGVLRSQ